MVLSAALQGLPKTTRSHASFLSPTREQIAASESDEVFDVDVGTGKTYVGVQIVRLMLANTRTSAGQPGLQPVVGPLLLVCKTNHALDSFLEDLFAAGITNLTRVGGQCGISRSSRLFALRTSALLLCDGLDRLPTP